MKDKLKEAIERAQEEMRATNSKQCEGIQKRSGLLIHLFRHFHPKGLTPVAVAKATGWTIKTTRARLTEHKKLGNIENYQRGLWRLKVCLTCQGKQFIPVETTEGVKYRPCPDCNTKPRTA